MANTAFVLLSALGCTGIDNALHEEATEPTPPVTQDSDAGPEYVEDKFVQTPSKKVDALFVIDNSNSMGIDNSYSMSGTPQDAILFNLPTFFPYFENEGVNYHIGVVTTDMDNSLQQGQLQGQYGFSYLATDTQSKITAQGLLDGDGNPLTTQEIFASMLNVGTVGAQEEKGLEATDYAINNYQNTGEANAGFIRSDADLNVIVVSDEDDFSEENAQQHVIGEFTAINEAGDKKAYFHSIVGVTAGECTWISGTRYIAVSEVLSSQVASICNDDWDTMLSNMAFTTAGLSREFYLSKNPIVDTIQVGVYDENPDGSGQYDLLYSPTVGTSSYDPVEYLSDTNSLRFTDSSFIPPAYSEVWVDYEVDNSTPASDTGNP